MQRSKIASLLRKIVLADPRSNISYQSQAGKVLAWFYSAIAKDDICSEYSDIVVRAEKPRVIRRAEDVVFPVQFDVGKPELEKPVTGYSLADARGHKAARRAVTEQEEEGARIIDGQRHVGSGAIEGLKSDASSGRWQQEAKQTAGKSIGLKLEWLDKITREARIHDKRPMMFLRFTDSPRHIVAEDDWVVIPKSVFEAMRKLEDG